MTAEVLCRVEGHAAVLSLNRPGALHALNLNMVRLLTAELQRLREQDAIRCVLLEHASGRGFCAGGDIRALLDSVQNDGGQSGRRFFYEEYQLDHLIGTYPKPVVAFMDGLTMGGGVGISLPASLRVVTERTRFAMPETGIGLFPDVGGGHYLSRLPQRLGRFLALTGTQLDGAECLWLGLGTHHVPGAALPQLKAALAQATEAPADVLRAHASAPPPARLAEHAARIARTFASDRLEDVLQALAQDGSDWAVRVRQTVAEKSPQACKIALRQLALGEQLPSLADDLRMEYRIASRVLVRPDFSEGVRAVIIDKDNAPRWSPATPEAVDEALLDAIFAPLSAADEWRPL